MNDLLLGKKILVAGAAGLLGRQVCEDIVAAGGDVIAVDLKFDHIKENRTELVSKIVDITSSTEVKTLFAEVGVIDGAVNCSYPRNASYGAHFFDVTQESFNENLSLNLGSAFLFTQQCAQYFKQTGRPFSLVNISSIYGVTTPKFDVYHNTSMTMPVEYAAIKAGLQHISRYAASYVNDSNFKVNCISPGGIRDNQPDTFLAAYRKYTHGKGMLDVKDVTGAILFLLSDLAKYVTGENIVVDDGFCL